MGNVSKQPSEGGSGGKRGHSNMEHWVYNDEIKDASRRRRRLDDDAVVREGLTDFDDSTKKTKG